MDICGTFTKGRYDAEPHRVALIMEPDGARISGIDSINIAQAVRSFYTMAEHQRNGQPCLGSGEHPDEIGTGAPISWGVLTAYCPAVGCAHFEIAARLD